MAQAVPSADSKKARILCTI